MDKVTFIRCGMVWLICAMFLYDGGKYVRAQEPPEPNTKGTLEDATAGNENDTAEPKDYSIPDWYDADATFNDSERMLFVQTGDSSATIAEAEEKLVLACRTAINQTMLNWLNIKQPEHLRFEKDYILENLVYQDRLAYRQDPDCKREAKKIGEDVDFFVGYTQLELNDAFREFVNEQVVDLRTRRRLVKGGLVGGSVLTLLAVIFGYLKMETATRGFYSRRLQTASLFVAITLLVMLYLAGKQLI